MNNAKNFRFGNHTDIGMARRQNEDYMGYFDTPNGHLFVVCDGMGGHLGGAVASQTAVKVIRNFMQAELYANPYQAIQEAAEQANQQIFTQAQTNPEVKGMGTTLVLALVRDNLVYYAHVGDSRIYLCRENQLKRLTKDHSVVQDMIDRGLIDESEAETHPRKNELLRALGVSSRSFQVDVCKEPLTVYQNDILLLCSDGLVSLVSDNEIFQTLVAPAELQAKAIHLVDTANKYGGYDNTTVQLIEFTEAPPKNAFLDNKSLSKTDPEMPAYNPAMAQNLSPEINSFSADAPEPIHYTPQPQEMKEEKKEIKTPMQKKKREKIEYILPSETNYFKIALWGVAIVGCMWLAYYVWENSLKKVKLSNLWQNNKVDSTQKVQNNTDTTQSDQPKNKILNFIVNNSSDAKEVYDQYKKAKKGYQDLKQKVKSLRDKINDVVELKGLRQSKKQVDSLLKKHEVIPYIYKGREDLEKMAKKYNTSVKKILEANDLISDRALENKKDTLFIPLELKEQAKPAPQKVEKKEQKEAKEE